MYSSATFKSKSQDEIKKFTYTEAIKNIGVYKIVNDDYGDEDGGRLVVLNNKSVFVIGPDGELCGAYNNKQNRYVKITDEIITITINTEDEPW